MSTTADEDFTQFGVTVVLRIHKTMNVPTDWTKDNARDAALDGWAVTEGLTINELVTAIEAMGEYEVALPIDVEVLEHTPA